MIFLYLILGHFLADFAFQPDELIEWKNRSWKGILIHTLVHFFFEILLLTPFLTKSNIVIVVLGIILLHFLIDRIKIYWEAKTHQFVLLFFLDQAAHLLVLAFGGFLLLPEVSFVRNEGFLSRFYGNPVIILYFILAIMVSYGVEIVKLQFLLEKNPAVKLKLDYIKISIRLGVFTIGYVFLNELFTQFF